MFYCMKCDNKWPHIHIMPMEEVLETRSGDAWNDEGTVRSVLAEKRDYRYDRILESIRDMGFKPGYEPEWETWGGDAMVVNGHHRITVLHDLGAQWFPDGRTNADVYA